MKIDEILKRLGLELGMKVLDKKPCEMYRCEDHVYTLVKYSSPNMIVFKGADGGYFQVLYVLTQLGKRFKVIENE